MNKRCLITSFFKGLIGLKMLLKETDKEYPPPIIIWKSNWDRFLWPGTLLHTQSEKFWNGPWSSGSQKGFNRKNWNWGHFHFAGNNIWSSLIKQFDHDDADLAAWLKHYGVRGMLWYKASLIKPNTSVWRLLNDISERYLRSNCGSKVHRPYMR